MSIKKIILGLILASSVSANTVSQETFFWGNSFKDQCYSHQNGTITQSGPLNCLNAEAFIYRADLGAFKLDYHFRDESLFGDFIKLLPKKEKGKLILSSLINDETDTVKLAQWLVKRQALRHEVGDENPEIDFYFGSQIKQIFPSVHINSIIKNGFLNSEQVGHSRGVRNRRSIEELVINAKM